MAAAINPKKHVAALAATLKKADAAYYGEHGRRRVKPIMSNAKYDDLRAELKRLDPANPALRRVGSEPKARDARRRKLPILVGSMEKATPAEVGKWAAKIEAVKKQSMWLGLPKLDGQSVLACYRDGRRVYAYTRGDGTVGRDVTAAFSHVQGALTQLKDDSHVPIDGDVLVRFECVMHKSIFQRFYAEKAVEGKLPEGYQNPRNLVAGLLNRIDVKESIADLRNCTAVALELWRRDPKKGWRRPSERHRELLYLSMLGLTPVTNPSRYTVGDSRIRKMVKDGHPALRKVLPVLPPSGELGKLVYYSKLPTPDEIKDRLRRVRELLDVDVDGLSFEPNDNGKFQDRGDHLQPRPDHRRAIKLEAYEQDSANTVLRGIDWEVSKRGLLKPTVSIRPVKLGGVTVTNFTANNAKQVQAWGYRPGVQVKVVRSGDVIPRIIGVRHATKSNPQARWIRVDSANLPAKPLGPSSLPKDCPACGTKLKWGSRNDLQCSNAKCVGRRTAGIVSFFKELGADDIGPGVAAQLVSAGMDDLPKVLAGATVPRLMRIRGFAKTKAETVAREVRDCLTDKPLQTIMHAAGVFQEAAFSLGSSRLGDVVKVLGEDGVMNMDAKRMRAKLYGVTGIGNETLEMFMRHVPEWRALWRQIGKYRRETTRKTLAGKIVAFTGFRDAEMEKFITARGAIVADGVSKRTDVLFAASLGSGKAVKADKYGVPVVKQADAWDWLKRNAK